MVKRRRVAKDKRTGLPKKYLGSTSGSKRAELARVLKRISTLAKAGKTIPRSVLKRRIELGRKKKKKSRKPYSGKPKAKAVKRGY